MLWAWACRVHINPHRGKAWIFVNVASSPTNPNFMPRHAVMQLRLLEDMLQRPLCSYMLTRKLSIAE
jgi:hypothetical protein